MTALPSLFLSHGSPMQALHPGRAGMLWSRLGRELARPSAILIASAHWESEHVMLTTGSNPETVHDFGGFPRELYAIQYAPPGAVAVAQRAIELLRSAGQTANSNSCRGLDHGAWVPLRHLYPAADIPVAQISVQPQLGVEHHLRVGSALAPLRSEGVLIIGSGHMTHNLSDYFARARGNGLVPSEEPAVAYVEEFRRWIDQALRTNDRAGLAQWLTKAPHARRAHPTVEHFLPLPLAFAAAGPMPRVERFDLGVDAGVLAMDAYAFYN